MSDVKRYICLRAMAECADGNMVEYKDYERLERDNAELKQKLDRYTRMSESGETLGDHLDLVESHTEIERENAELRKQLEQAEKDNNLYRRAAHDADMRTQASVRKEMELRKQLEQAKAEQRKLTDDEVWAWAARYDIQGSLLDISCMIEDARTLHNAIERGE